MKFICGLKNLLNPLNQSHRPFYIAYYKHKCAAREGTMTFILLYKYLMAEGILQMHANKCQTSMIKQNKDEMALVIEWNMSSPPLFIESYFDDQPKKLILLISFTYLVDFIIRNKKCCRKRLLRGD